MLCLYTGVDRLDGTAPVRWNEMSCQGAHHFVLFPRTVKVNMTVEPFLQNSPSTSLRFHVTIGLRI